MSVRKNHRDKWMIDIKFEHLDGSITRVRKTAFVQTKRGAEAQEREIRNALQAGTYRPDEEPEVITVESFSPPAAAVETSTALAVVPKTPPAGVAVVTASSSSAITVERYADAFIAQCELTTEKATSLESKESHLRAHLLPLFGDRPLDSFRFDDWGRLRKWLLDRQKARLDKRAKKKKAKGLPLLEEDLKPSNGISTFNNVASTLNTMIELASKQGYVSPEAYRFTLIPRQDEMVEFYDFEEFEELVYAAREHSSLALVIVLLGGEAGLRRSEMYPLLWSSCNLPLRQLAIHKAENTVKRKASPEVTRELGTTKTGVNRIVRMTDRVLEALQRHRHEQGQKGGRVVLRPNGMPFTDHPFRDFLIEVQRRAGLPATGNVHILRHTFCSHMAMKGAPLSSIQKAAGHTSIKTTMRYIHLIPSEVDRAIDTLNDRTSVLGAGWVPKRLREGRQPGEEAAE